MILRNMFFNFKKMKYLFFVPIIFYYVLLPLILLGNKLNPWGDTEEITSVLYAWIPIISVWWISLFHKEYIDERGGEVLYVYGDVFSQTFFLWLANQVLLLPILSFSLFLDEFNGPMVYLDLLLINALICGIDYYLNFSFQSVPLAFFVVIIYAISSGTSNLEGTQELGIWIDKFMEYVNYYKVVDLDWMLEFTGYAFVLATMVFWGLGYWKSKRLE